MLSPDIQSKKHSVPTEPSAVPPLSLKGGMTAHALLPVHAQATLYDASTALTELLQDSPGEFDYTPCILAFPGRERLPDWLPQWLETLRQYRLVPFAVQCAGADNLAQVRALGLADMPIPDPGTRRPRAVTDPAPPLPPIARPCRVIHTQVRSGQQIYARDSDLVILASVSAGAEVMADYDVHIYGDLRGRALAGVSGNAKAQIFCQTLDAELVAITGVYILPEQFPEARSRVQIQLEHDQLVITGS